MRLTRTISQHPVLMRAEILEKRMMPNEDFDRADARIGSSRVSSCCSHNGLGFVFNGLPSQLHGVPSVNGATRHTQAQFARFNFATFPRGPPHRDCQYLALFC